MPDKFDRAAIHTYQKQMRAFYNYHGEHSLLAGFVL